MTVDLDGFLLELKLEVLFFLAAVADGGFYYIIIEGQELVHDLDIERYDAHADGCADFGASC